VDKNIIGAVQYILNNFKENGNKFYDRSVVGTGHRGLLNLQYPVYAYSFPVIALARAKTYFSGQKKSFINDELNSKVIQYESFGNSTVEEL
jgi:squalene-hopene/tetraprenyl-beta-curcumene cyclase